MNEKMKCFNIHGHTYLAEIVFSFENLESIGYAIDFKEVKRVGLQWIDDMLDHGMILNPHDKILIDTTTELQGKLWLMSLNGEGNYCNPTAENIGKEIFLAIEILFSNYKSLEVFEIKLNETPNCCVQTFATSIKEEERENFYKANLINISEYRDKKGILEYDDRK
jgi:6-pyruvoyltetrahydropterin/6-carboxytetrahydropterin synthase